MRGAWTWGACAGLALALWLGALPRLFGLPGWLPVDTDALADLSLRGVAHPIAAGGLGLLYWAGAAAIVPGAAALLWRRRRPGLALRRSLAEQEQRIRLAAVDQGAEEAWARYRDAEAAGDLDGQIRQLEEYEDRVELALLERQDREARLERCVEAAERIGRSNPERAAALLRRADAIVRRRGRGGAWSLVRHDVLGYALGAAMGALVLPAGVVFLAVAVGVAVFVLKVLLVIAVIALLLALFGAG